MAGDTSSNLKVLMVAEKTSIAQTLASVFGGTSVERRSGLSPRSPVFEYDGSFKGERAHFKVTATQGHVYSMDFADEYNDSRKHSAEELFTCPVVKSFDKDARLPEHLAAEGAGCHVLMLWLDCDREGENICFEVMKNVVPAMDKSRSFPDAYHERIFRANFSSLLAADLQHAMTRLGVPKEDESSSVDARMEIDLRLGIAFSRFQTQYFRQHLGSRMRDLIKSVTYGPCQMPTLWFCVHRHCQIQAFSPKPFWRLKVPLSGDGGSTEFPAEATCGQMWSKNEAELLLRKVCSAEYARVTSIDKRRLTEQRPLPLNTVTMLQQASKLAGLSPGDAMHHAEQLYMKGFLSYPRTETSRYPSEFDAGAAIQMFQAAETPWATVARRLMANRTAPRVDGVDHGDHPPITPVQLASKAQCGDANAWNLYQLVCSHFLATFAPDCIFVETEVKFDLGGAPLSAKSSSRTPDDFAWCDVLSSDLSTERGPAQLQHLQVGSKCLAGDSELLEQATSPPSHLNESDLLGLMEKHGIGTDASMATHISNVLKRKYVKLDAKSRQLTPTGLGLALAHAYTLLDPGLVRPTVRAKIENACARVAKGEAQRQEVVDQALRVFRQKFQNFSRRIDRVPAMLAMAYAPEQDRGRVRTASSQWDFATRETAAIKLEHLLLVRGCQEIADEEQAGSEVPELRPGLLVRIDGLKAAPKLNGQLGICEHFDADAGRWHIHLPSGETKALKKENLLGIAAAQLWPGLPVRVQGLKGSPQLNGQEGTCKHWDSASGRWQVSLKSNEVKSLKLENLQEITEGEVADHAAADAKKELEALGLSGTDNAEHSSWQQKQNAWEDEAPRKQEAEAEKATPSRTSDAWESEASGKWPKVVTPPRSRAKDTWESEAPTKKPKVVTPPSTRASDAWESKPSGHPPETEKSSGSSASDEWGSGPPAKWRKVVLPPNSGASDTWQAQTAAQAGAWQGQTAAQAGTSKAWENESAAKWPKVVTPPGSAAGAVWESQRSAQKPDIEAHAHSHDKNAWNSETSMSHPKVVAPPRAQESTEKEPIRSPTVVLPPRSGQSWANPPDLPQAAAPPSASSDSQWQDSAWKSPKVVAPPGAAKAWENEPTAAGPKVVLPPRAAQAESSWGMDAKMVSHPWASDAWEGKTQTGHSTQTPPPPPPPSAQWSGKDEPQKSAPEEGKHSTNDRWGGEWASDSNAWWSRKDESQTHSSKKRKSKDDRRGNGWASNSSERWSRNDKSQQREQSSNDKWGKEWTSSSSQWWSRTDEPETHGSKRGTSSDNDRWGKEWAQRHAAEGSTPSSQDKRWGNEWAPHSQTIAGSHQDSLQTSEMRENDATRRVSPPEQQNGRQDAQAQPADPVVTPAATQSSPAATPGGAPDNGLLLDLTETEQKVLQQKVNDHIKSLVKEEEARLMVSELIVGMAALGRSVKEISSELTSFLGDFTPMFMDWFVLHVQQMQKKPADPARLPVLPPQTGTTENEAPSRAPTHMAPPPSVWADSSPMQHPTPAPEPGPTPKPWDSPAKPWESPAQPWDSKQSAGYQAVLPPPPASRVSEVPVMVPPPPRPPGPPGSF